MNRLTQSADLSRREFLTDSFVGGAAVAAGLSFATAAKAEEPANKQQDGPLVVAFTKSFQDRSIPEVCEMFKGIGLDGLDLTVRPRGHIEPKDVATELPKAVAAAKQAGVQIPFLTTGIVTADAEAELLLKTAADLGIDRIKLGYYRYKPFGTLVEQMDEVRKQLDGVVQLAKKYKVLPCVHIHSGTHLPSHGTQLYELIRDYSPEEVGAYVDPLHMTLEGGGDGWRQGLDLLAPWVALSSMKNFDYEPQNRDKTGQLRWHTRVVPLADGIAPIPDFVATLKKIGYHGIYSLHSEYKGRHSWQDLDTDACLKQTAADLQFLRPLL